MINWIKNVWSAFFGKRCELYAEMDSTASDGMRVFVAIDQMAYIHAMGMPLFVPDGKAVLIKRYSDLKVRIWIVE